MGDYKLSPRLTPRLTRRALIVSGFLGAQAVAVKWAAGEERLPPIPDLSRLPDHIGSWKKLTESAVDPEVQAQLHADRLLSRTYLDGKTGAFADFFVGWFRSQRGGVSQPHSPQVCLPGNGWTPTSTQTVSLETSAGNITVNRYAVAQKTQRAVTVYWYQTPRRVIASEWAAKFWIVPDALRDRRTDTSLVRIFAWNGPRSDDETTAIAQNFAREAYPVLRDLLPR